MTTQPSLSAHMVQALRLTGVERVLEIGTGYGYQTALLARLASFVTSIERWPDLAAQALRNLAGQTIDNVSVVVGDGTEGVPNRRRTTRCWFPPPSPRFPARWSTSYGPAGGWCSRSVRAVRSR